MASTNSTPPQMAAARQAVLRIIGTNTTSSTPMIAADAKAWPEGNDSLVSMTSRNSSGGRCRPTVAFPTMTSSPAPADTVATSTAFPRRPRIHRTSTATVAITPIDRVLPSSVMVMAAAVSAGVRWVTAHSQMTGSIAARPLCSTAPSASPRITAASTPSSAPLVSSNSATPGADRRHRMAATRPSASSSTAPIAYGSHTYPYSKKVSVSVRITLGIGRTTSVEEILEEGLLALLLSAQLVRPNLVVVPPGFLGGPLRPVVVHDGRSLGFGRFEPEELRLGDHQAFEFDAVEEYSSALFAHVDGHAAAFLTAHFALALRTDEAHDAAHAIPGRGGRSLPGGRRHPNRPSMNDLLPFLPFFFPLPLPRYSVAIDAIVDRSAIGDRPPAVAPAEAGEGPWA